MTEAPTILTTPRLILRKLRPQDAPDLVRALNDYEVSKWLSRVPFPYTVHDANWFTPRGGAKPLVFGIEYKGRIIGTIGCEGEFGYWLSRAHWGKGLMPEAAEAVLTACFAAGQSQIEAGYFEGNARSPKVLRRMGFKDRGGSVRDCLARGHKLARRDMILTRAGFAARKGN